ncbi:early endosome antigen 1 isoform X16 [Macrobrachium rosenbergii]|uniref:early endosome antigen 1 isoform X16 n=1 Tax=Macrobrachium rosenbergii TaxID=79674 RepID=UPI0034D3BA0A
MPKANDPLCPLGFHPQTRWPNRCKRCFRDYNDHQSVKNQSGSNTSLNSLSSYDSSTNTFIRRQDDEGAKEPPYSSSRDSLVSPPRSPREDYEVYKRSRSDMTAELLARVNEDPGSSSSSSSSKDRDSRGGGGSGGSSSSSSSKLTSWNKARPTSWSAQDLRAAVDEAKEQIRSSREDLHRLYGSTKSLTTRDLGSLGDLRDSSSDLTKDSSSTPYSSFSSYLAMRTKSPARPPLARTSSLQGTTSTSSAVRREEEESKKLKEQATASEESSSRTKLSSTDSTTTKPRSSLLSTSLLENKTTSYSSSSATTPSKSSLSSIAEGKKSSLSTTTSSSSNSTSSSEAKPPKPPSRLKTTGSKLGDISEAPKDEKPRKNILSLRGDLYNSSEEVKSEDDSVDASYVIQLAKPKKEPKRVEIDLQSEVDRLHKELKEKVQEVKEFEERVQTLEREKKELSSKRSVFGGGDVRKHTELSRMQQKVDDLNDDMKSKNKEIKDLKKEIEKRPLPKDVEKTMEDLRSKLQAAEQLCEELMDENEEYKKEVKALEDEIEEMQDNFREEQADEYRDLKRELEQTAKNCRVLQFKLKKAERRSEMLERDKGEIDDKLKELQVGESDVQKAEKIKYLEKEVNLAKEVSMKMHDEMEKMKKQLEEAEQDKKILTEKFKDQPIKPGGKYSRSQMMGRQGSQDNTDQLMRDLQDAGEREQDLKDQLKFAEEETKNLRKKLSRVEEENETLALQLKKMSNKAKADRQRSLERSGSLERASSVERGQLSRQGSTEKPPVKEPDEGITEDLDPTELKIQLELNEQEAAVLRRKVEDLESENERLQREIKGVLSSADLRTKKGDSSGDSQRLEKEAELLRTKVSDIEQENEKLLEENKRLQLKAVKRLPLSGSESSYIERQVMEDKVRRLEKKLKETNDKLKNAQLNASSSSIAGNNIDARLHVALMDTDKSKKGRPASEDLTSLRDLEDKLERERERNDELSRQLKEEREKLDNKPLANRRKAGGQDDDVRRLEERVESLKKDLAKEKEKSEELKAKAGSAAGVGFEEHRAAQTEKHKLQKELATAQQTTASLEKKLKEIEENLKFTEKSEREAKLALEKLQFKLDEEKTSVSQAEERQKELTTSWLKEREEMKDELSEYKKGKEKAERDLRLAKKARDSLETKFEDEKKRANEADSKKKREADEIKTLKNENKELNNEVDDLRNKVLQMEKNQGTADTKQKKEVETLRLEKQGLEIRMATLESELKTEQKKRERLEKEKEKSSSLVMYKDSAERAESNLKKLKRDMESSKQDYEDKIKTLEKKNAVDKQELADLQNKYELLEEEFVVQKAQYTTALENKELSTVRENNQQDFAALKKDHDTIEIELRTLRETYNLRQDTWIKEKLDMQEQLKSLEDRFNKVSLDPASYSEKKRLMDIIDDKNQQIERYRRDEEAIKDQVSYYRRESEELRRKVEDFEKLQELSERKESSRPTKDTSSYDTTIRELRSKLSSVEKTNKTELTKLKMKYDSKMKAMTEEVSTLTQHMTKYRRERDTYKEMLDGAQRSLAEMKGNTNFRTSRADAASERGSVQRQMDLKAQQHLQETQELQSQVTEFEDKLADAKIENAKMKNDIIDQKTNYEIQLCDLQTKLNEYEEDRLLGGGSRRVPGLRTRLELNWQKEREEQQRLIQETATLAKDLRQTLYEVERERDLERLESKRKIDQLKKTVGQESSDTKSKVQELQRDLLELREAHAKLRQINEKLRREKDRTEVEREAMRDKFLGTSREHLNQQTKMERLSDEMKLVKDLAPLVLGEGIDGRDSSLTRLPGEPKPRTKEEFTEALKKACRTMDEMKRMYNLFDDKDRLKRAPSFRRALSDLDTDDEGPPLRPRSAQRGGLKPLSKGQKSTLYRKTQSLDHQMAEDRGKIWVSTDAGSTTSIDSTMTDDLRRAKYDRDVSLDRISTGSQTSDLDSIAGDKKKKGLKGVMSKFGKSRSIEESGTGSSIVGAGLKAMGVGVGGSGSDIPTDVEKDSVKGKLKGLFKKGPPSRSQSVDRATDNVNVKSTASTYEYDTASMASNTSLDSNASANLPPVMRRLKGRNNLGAMTKAQSFTAIGRQSSVETDV